MSQQALGEHLGITFQQVQKYEKGTNRVAASTLRRISEILNIPVLYLLTGGKTDKGEVGDALTDAYGVQARNIVASMPTEAAKSAGVNALRGIADAFAVGKTPRVSGSRPGMALFDEMGAA
jgi:transcriptional regulator with XRE-family HTH domain